MKATTKSGYELHFHVIREGPWWRRKTRYVLDSPIVYWSRRYHKEVLVEVGFKSDGASFIAMDIVTRGWWVHDKVCITYRFADNTTCTRWQGSVMLYDILREDGYYIRAPFWCVVTWLGNPCGGR